MDNYIIIGGGKLQVNFIKKAKDLGFVTHVFDYDQNCPGRYIADAFYCLSIDDKEAILKIATEIKPVGIHTVATEMGNITSCYVGEKLGLHTNSFLTAIATTDKSVMKEVFSKNNIPTPFSICINNVESIPSDISFPIMVKASDRSAGRGIRLVRNRSELYEAFEDSIAVSYNKKVLIEEYFEGMQFSVELISNNGNHRIIAITEENLDGPPFFVEQYHLLPARLTQTEYKLIEEVSLKTLDAFNVLFGASHIELRINSGSVKIIEVASRMGGYRDSMINYALGIDYLKLILFSSLGIEIDFEKKWKKYSIIRWIVNNNDYKLYDFVKQNYRNILKEEDVEQVGIGFNAKTLMEVKGHYILSIEDEKLLDLFYNR